VRAPSRRAPASSSTGCSDHRGGRHGDGPVVLGRRGSIARSSGGGQARAAEARVDRLVATAPTPVARWNEHDVERWWRIVRARHEGGSRNNRRARARTWEPRGAARRRDGPCALDVAHVPEGRDHDPGARPEVLQPQQPPRLVPDLRRARQRAARRPDAHARGRRVAARTGRDQGAGPRPGDPQALRQGREEGAEDRPEAEVGQPLRGGAEARAVRREGPRRHVRGGGSTSRSSCASTRRDRLARCVRAPGRCPRAGRAAPRRRHAGGGALPPCSRCRGALPRGDREAAPPRARRGGGRSDPAGDRLAGAVPRTGGARLHVARPQRAHAVGRRVAAHPPRGEPRLRPARRVLGARRADDRPPPARQRPAPRGPRRPARPGEQPRGRGARRGHDPPRRPPDRHGPRRRP
jgi:hypothetical protein